MRSEDDARHRPVLGDRRRCARTGTVYTYDGWYKSHPVAVWARTGVYPDAGWEWAPLGGAFPTHTATTEAP